MNREDRNKLLDTVVDLFNHGLDDGEIFARLLILADGPSEPTTGEQLVAIIRDLMTDPIKCRIIVSMHGGTIEDVVHDNKQVDIADVVFLEDRKYQSEEPEFFVEAGQFKDQFVYTHMSSDLPAAGAFKPVMLAAQRRIRYAEETENLRK